MRSGNAPLRSDTIAMLHRDTGRRMRYKPFNCPHCEYDRRFPGFESGGWIRQDNNGPIVSCPVCNPDQTHPLK